MRGEHELDPQRGGACVQRLRRDALREQPREAVGERPTLRRAAGEGLIIASPSDPVMLLGDVREAEEVGETACDGERLCDREGAKRPFEFGEIGRLVARDLCECANLLHCIEQAVAALFVERPPQEVAEQADVVVESLVRVSGHRRGTGSPSRTCIPPSWYALSNSSIQTFAMWRGFTLRSPRVSKRGASSRIHSTGSSTLVTITREVRDRHSAFEKVRSPSGERQKYNVLSASHNKPEVLRGEAAAKPPLN